jgi:hypothetical protein
MSAALVFKALAGTIAITIKSERNKQNILFIINNPFPSFAPKADIFPYSPLTFYFDINQLKALYQLCKS